jgi:hypothetical protein
VRKGTCTLALWDACTFYTENFPVEYYTKAKALCVVYISMIRGINIYNATKAKMIDK